VRWRGISTESVPESYLPLTEQMRRIRENTEKYVAPEVTAVHERAIANLRKQGIASRALQPGAPAPWFAIPDQNGHFAY
jgi:hypothetical protein